MHTLLLALALLASAVAPASASTVLVAHPPTYEVGASRVGRIIMPTGEEFAALQMAEQGQHGRVQLRTLVRDPAGNILIEMVSDPQGWAIAARTPHGTTNVLATTCSMTMLYPIVQGRVYTCVSRVSENGVLAILRERIEVESFTRNAAGAVDRICFLHSIVADGLDTRVRSCSTGDMRWMIEMQYLPSGRSL